MKKEKNKYKSGKLHLLGSYFKTANHGNMNISETRMSGSVISMHLKTSLALKITFDAFLGF